ncbi:ferredoxin [Kitasatospora purpeofusca]|uniref:ferredoxin n=1 Tax=Kitasatospora purpeofusca TaxID=67352 RepID=UPI003661ECC2
MTYWDPIPAVRALVGTPHPMWQDGVVRHDWSGPAPDGWANRDWRNVPGPFYTTGTDNCFTGRRCAPEHVAYEDEYCTEFVYRQPVEVAGVHELTCAGECDPFGAYGGDGDRHWTPDLVRDWWGERGRAREWALRVGRGEWATSEREQFRDVAAGARAYLAHLDHGLGEYLRDYVFWLSEGRPAAPGERLPKLDT